MLGILTKKTFLAASGLALLLTASATAQCGKSYGTWRTSETFAAIGGPWMTMDVIVGDSATGCNITIADILLYGVSGQQVVEFETPACSTTHYYATNSGNIWFDALTDCDTYGYINIPTP